MDTQGMSKHPITSALTSTLAERARGRIGIFLLSAFLTACGGGGTTPTSAPPAKSQLVGEIFSTPAQLSTAELAFTAGYAGNLTTSRAIKAAGKTNLVDLLLLFPEPTAQGRVLDRLRPDAEQRLIAYISSNGDLLTPGVRVLILDEIFWNPPDQSDSDAVLQPQLEAFQAAVALVKKHIPNASVGITVTPYATFGRPNTLRFIQTALKNLDWVGTDPYWLGDRSVIPALHEWSASFHSLAKSAKPTLETWFVAQAFRLPSLDLPTFNAYIAQHLLDAERYDHVLFFGWQFASELDPSTAGKNFPVETKQLYRKYLNSTF